MLWQAGEPRPRLLRVVNLSADSVAVFVEECLASRRVGDVGPERTRLFGLPEALIAWNGALRFHTVRPAGSPRADVVVTALPIDTARVLRLEVPKEVAEPCPIDAYVDGKRVVGDTLPVPREMVIGVEYYTPEARPPGMEGKCPAVNIRTRK